MNNSSNSSRPYSNRKPSSAGSINTAEIEEAENDDQNEEYDGGSSEDGSDREYTLKDRQDTMNYTHPFGLPLWKPALYKKSRSVTRNANSAVHSAPSSDLYIHPGNILWAVLFGWWLALISFILSLTLLKMPFGGWQYSRVLRELSYYILWPFNKYVEIIEDEFLMDEEEASGRFHAFLENNDGIDSNNDEANADESSISRDVHGRRRIHSSANETNSEERRPLLSHRPSYIEVHRLNREKKNLFNQVGEMGPAGLIFYFWFYLIIAPLFLLVSALCWLAVIPIPMAKLTYILTRHLRRHPLSLNFKSGSTQSSYSYLILLCTHEAIGFQYYKYTFDGINIIFINLIPLVFFAIIDDYILKQKLKLDYFFTKSEFIFSITLASVIPLSYFIGMAVASISAQSSAGLGAVINATFGSIVEIILYAMALKNGRGKLTEGSIIGSLMAGVLLMPGVSMVSGAFKHKEQRFNAKSAGVTSTMLIMAIIGALTPTLFYQIYSSYKMICRPCSSGLYEDCQECDNYHVDPIDTELYNIYVTPLMYFCASVLILSYLIGLWFTLRTHAALVWQTGHHHTFPDHNQQITSPTTAHASPHHSLSQHSQQHSHPHSNSNIRQDSQDFGRISTSSDTGRNHPLLVNSHILHQTPNEQGHFRFAHEPEEEEPIGHNSPNWSKAKSGIVLLVCTALYSLIAEILVGNVQVILKDGSGEELSQSKKSSYEKIAGLTLFALVPNVTEFVNAMAFSLYGNIALSMEIGSAYALQVCLLQIPAMVAFSGWYNHGKDYEDKKGHTFTLVFPRWDVFAVVFSVFLLTYTYIEGKSNYFKGSILILSYLVLMAGFFFAPQAPFDNY